MNPRLRTATIAASVVIVDRITKLYIQAQVSQRDMVPVIPTSATSFIPRIQVRRSECSPIPPASGEACSC